METFKVTFYPDNKSIRVNNDTSILSAAISAGVHINSVCAGEGVCGRCKVIVKKGKVLAQPTGMLSVEEKNKGVCLACITTIHSDLEIEIPPQSRLEEKISQQDERFKGLYSESEEIEPVKGPQAKETKAYSPLTAKLYLELPKPDLKDRLSDLERIYRQISRTKGIPCPQTGLANIRQLGELLRDADWKITVTLGKREAQTELILIEPQDTSSKNFGFCFDIGTTTISGQLVDLKNKKVLGTRAIYNRQAAFGSDVISRIIYAQEESGLEKLHLAVAECVNQIIHELAQEHKVDLNNVTGIVCTGNTTMMHLLLSIDPTYIRREPYVPVANFLPVMRAAEAGIKINPRGLLYCASGVSSYIGADATAGVLSCGLDKEKDLCLLIDIGTNGEIVLGNRDFLIAASASAGPAFEGSGVTCGMRASRGAIQKIKISRRVFQVAYSTIGQEKPRGICGSGYIDALAQMLSSGLMDKSGKLSEKESANIRQNAYGRYFVVAGKKESAIKEDIIITEADIENLKRAKAAIYSAVSILVRHIGMKFDDIKKVFISGGFGTYLDFGNAVNIGLLPDLDSSRFVFVGNSSLAGARAMLLSDEAIKKAEEIAAKITYFELSVEPDYMDEYMAALFFPHTDLTKFPSFKLKP